MALDGKAAVRAVLLAACIAGPLASSSWGAEAADPRVLARDYGCMACHGLVHKQVGPGFAQIAERYRGDPARPAALAAKIRGGSVGSWGRVIMPRQPKVSDADAALLAAWVLSQPSP